jgi:CRISPR/Cas system CSM-associated protein Csm3 (group 7 of RAMP superfamily)
MKYQVKFFDYWHLSSGMSAGPALDSLVVKDEDGLPYIPGKTIKGLIREMAEILDKEKSVSIFGKEGANIADSYFSNATLDEATHMHLRENPTLKEHLYSKVSATKIDAKNGIADDKSLREIEVVVPLILVGELDSVDDEFIQNAMAMIKQMGLNRNRGLGRCQVGVLK